jgi:hypothetical protein
MLQSFRYVANDACRSVSYKPLHRICNLHRGGVGRLKTSKQRPLRRMISSPELRTWRTISRALSRRGTLGKRSFLILSAQKVCERRLAAGWLTRSRRLLRNAIPSSRLLIAPPSARSSRSGIGTRTKGAAQGTFGILRGTGRTQDKQAPKLVYLAHSQKCSAERGSTSTPSVSLNLGL